jgi:hypothetical protein
VWGIEREGKSNIMSDEVLLYKMRQMSAASVNKLLVAYFPELNSPYGKWPLEVEPCVWLDPLASRTPKLPIPKNAEGQPAFIPTKENAGFREDYVWGTGPRGRGYYHLLTQTSYKILLQRLGSVAVPCSCFSSKARKAMEQKRMVHIIISNRANGSVPNDSSAAKEGVSAVGVSGSGGIGFGLAAAAGAAGGF